MSFLFLETKSGYQITEFYEAFTISNYTHQKDLMGKLAKALIHPLIQLHTFVGRNYPSNIFFIIDNLLVSFSKCVCSHLHLCVILLLIQEAG